MTDSAFLKIDRAKKHNSDLATLCHTKQPYIYTLSTNLENGQRYTYAKPNQPILDTAALICGDVVHNLRTALDHAFWEIVSPFATTDKERRNIQFPFAKDAAELKDKVKGRLAGKVSKKFEMCLLNLAPHSGEGGHVTLCHIHELDILDKHKLLIPTVSYARVSFNSLRSELPDFPLSGEGNSFTGVGRHVAWYTNLENIDREKIGTASSDQPHVFERELDIHVDITLPGGKIEGNAFDQFERMASAAKGAVKAMRICVK